MEFVAQLTRFADAADGVQRSDDLFAGRASHAEYVVCTQALDSSRANAVLGFTLLLSPAGLVLFLASGQLVSLNLIADSSTLRTADPSAAQRSGRAAQPHGDQQSFELFIRSLLSGTVSQPLLQLGAGAQQQPQPSAKESLELLLHATQVLRDQYFPQHERVRQELEKRVKLLQLMRAQQRADIEQLLRDKEAVRSTAERLAERYEDIQESQLAVFRRAQQVARLVAAANPQSSAAETEFKQQVERIGVQAKRLAANIAAARRRMAGQEQQVEQFQGAQRQRARVMVLQPRMEATIQSLMGEL